MTYFGFLLKDGYYKFENHDWVLPAGHVNERLNEYFKIVGKVGSIYALKRMDGSKVTILNDSHGSDDGDYAPRYIEEKDLEIRSALPQISCPVCGREMPYSPLIQFVCYRCPTWYSDILLLRDDGSYGGGGDIVYQDGKYVLLKAESHENITYPLYTKMNGYAIIKGAYANETDAMVAAGCVMGLKKRWMQIEI